MSIEATVWGLNEACVSPPAMMYHATQGKALSSTVTYLRLSTINSNGDKSGELEIVFKGPTGRQRAEKIAVIINADDEDFGHE